MFLILALFLGFEGAKNIYILKVLIWGFGGLWRFLTGVLHSDIDFDMVTGFCSTIFCILALYLDFKVQRASMSFKSSFGALEDAGGS